jgi:hypothetical protein
VISLAERSPVSIEAMESYTQRKQGTRLKVFDDVPVSKNTGKYLFFSIEEHQFHALVKRPSIHDPASKKLSAPITHGGVELIRAIIRM